MIIVINVVTFTSTDNTHATNVQVNGKISSMNYLSKLSE